MSFICYDKHLQYSNIFGWFTAEKDTAIYFLFDKKKNNEIL